MRWIVPLAGALSLLAPLTSAIELNLDDEASVKSAASTIAYGLLSYYTGNNTGDTPGNLPDPYFWWEAGAMFGTMVDYWYYTGDASYNEATTQALLHQASPTADFMPENQTRTEGNDDQGFWAMAVMSAAENRFPDPPADQPQWLAIAQAVFNQYASRWDTDACAGGLRWQIFTFNNGFNYKNSISNGCFFNIAARLARFTGNGTYADWATRIWDWEVAMGLITERGQVFDGVTINNLTDCTDRDHIQWSYNAGIFLHGAAVMYDVTGQSAVWKARVDALLAETTRTFTVAPAANDNGTAAAAPVLYEQFCEPRGFCNIDQRTFKGYLARWLAGTTHMAPHTADTIGPLLRSSAAAAAAACSGSPPASEFRGLAGTACGFRWTETTTTTTTAAFDGMVGVGEQMNALSAVMYTLAGRAEAPVTADTGGTSRGDPGAGIADHSPYKVLPPITTGDRVAAGFLTTAIVFSVIGGSVLVMS